MSAPGPGIKRRVAALFFSTVGFLAFLAGRVFWIQFVRGEELRARAEEVRTRYIPVEPKRGVIYDRRGRVLAMSISADTVVANPAEIRDPRRTADQLAAALDMPRDEVFRVLTRRTSFEYVKRKISEQQAQAVRRLDLPGVYLTQESRRVYPKGELAANVLGFAGMDSQGLDGIERVYDDKLRGKPGYIAIEYDARNREIPQAVHRYIPAQDGLSVQLTLDETIQYIAERELDKAMAQWQPKAAWVIVMDPRTGEILALAQRPSYDPNKAMDYLIHGDPSGKADADPKLWRNLAISDAYPPGSVFKPVTAAMALADGKVTPTTPFYDTGSLTVPGSVITNWDGAGLGATNFTEAFALSANTIFARVGLAVGLDRFYQYLSAFGFDAYTGIDLPGEAIGLAPPRNAARPLDLALMAFGQTLTVTPIRMAVATAALINGGRLVRPHVVRAFLNKDGRVVEPVDPGPGKQVIPPQVSDTVRRLMGEVTGEGTGRRANVPGYRIGGKTGTSQKVIGGRVSTERHIASFIGFAPLDDPQVLTYVMVDEPKGLPYGGVVAAPIFAAIMRDVLHYLGIPPTEKGAEGEPGAASQLPPGLTAPRREDQVEVPDVLNLPLQEARGLAAQAGLAVTVEGQGQTVRGQLPPGGVLVPRGSSLRLFTGGPGPGGVAGGLVTVPRLAGKTMREVAQLLGAMGLNLEASGSGVAAAQDPAPGTQVPTGATVRVRFEPPPAAQALLR